MAQELYNTRLPSDTAQRVDEYMEEHDISKSEAVRRLVSAGLERVDECDQPHMEMWISNTVRTMGSAALTSAIILIILSSLGLSLSLVHWLAVGLLLFGGLMFVAPELPEPERAPGVAE